MPASVSDRRLALALRSHSAVELPVSRILPPAVRWEPVSFTYDGPAISRSIWDEGDIGIPLNASRQIASVNCPVDKRQKLRPPAISIFPLLVKTSLLLDIIGPRVDGVHITSGDKWSRFVAALGIFSPLVRGCARITPRDP